MISQENPHLYALVAGETSGDTLGSGLMMAIKRRDPLAQFIGIGGPKMVHQGMFSSANMEDLSVMGITEVLLKLPKILKIRNRVIKTIIEAKPCVFIGIDLPDFNLYVEQKVKAQGIPTVHYVSPSVWAWREGRIEKIRKACDEVLALLPFEEEWYRKHDMACTYVGHTLANYIPVNISMQQARERIDLIHHSVEPVKRYVMGILPGSRRGVISKMLPIYAQTARKVKKKLPETVFICTVPSLELATVLLTCGTIALETMLLKTPFAVAYKVSPLTALIARRLLKVKVYSLPNLIAGRKVVKEFIQEDCTPQLLAEEMHKLLIFDNILMKKEFEEIHRSMICNSDELACDAVFKVIHRHYDDLPPLESEANIENSEPVITSEPEEENPSSDNTDKDNQA